MKKGDVVTTLVLLTVALISCSKDNSVDIVEWPPSVVVGTVTEGTSGTPIDSATISARSGPDSTDKALGTETTDIDGRYRLMVGFYEGEVYVVANKVDFAPDTQAAYVRKYDTVVVNLELDRR